MKKANYEVVVLGCGGIGSGAAYWLARRAGSEVLGLEQAALSHPHGGSQDHSRIIRLTYHHQDYTRLTPHAYTAWAVLEQESAVPVVTRTGSVELALKYGPHQRDIEAYASAMDAPPSSTIAAFAAFVPSRAAWTSSPATPRSRAVG